MTTARLTISASMFAELIEQLARRGQGRREAGAFLLTDRGHSTDILPLPVTAIAYYEDLDPACLTGGITFHSNGYTALNARCRHEGLRVIGDIHTHPTHRVLQSSIDAQHPMVGQRGGGRKYACLAPVAT